MLFLLEFHDLIPLYDIQVAKHPGKFQQDWLGPYIVKEVTNGGAIQLATLHGDLIPGFVNGSRLKPYQATDYVVAPVQ